MKLLAQNHPNKKVSRAVFPVSASHFYSASFSGLTTPPLVCSKQLTQVAMAVSRTVIQPYAFDPESDPDAEQEEEEPPRSPRMPKAVSEWLVNFIDNLLLLPSPSLISVRLHLLG